jgi:hypothetical protein
MFNQGKNFPYGPPSAETIIEPASSGEESEVETTDLSAGDNRLLLQKTIIEGKGGPRMKHIVDQIIDVQFLKSTPIPVERVTNYLTIEGIEAS